MTQTVLITGANRGIGLGLVRHYLKAGCNVMAVARSESSELTAMCEKDSAHLTIHQLDVTDFAAVDQLAATLGKSSIDLLINNAGVYSDLEDFGSIDYDSWRRVLEVNTLAPTKVAEALSPCLKDGATLVCISSIMGSIAKTDGISYIYGSSKAALNMVAKLLASSLKDRGIKVLALHPGSVVTDMNPNGDIKIEESVEGMTKVIASANDNDSGSFKDYNGKALPW